VIAYSTPAQRFDDTLTPTVVFGTIDPDFPVANLTDNDPSTLFKTTSSAICLQYDRGASAGFGLMSVINVDFTNLSLVEIIVSDDPTFVGTHETYPFTVTSLSKGFYDNPVIDLRGRPGRRYVRLYASGTGIFQAGQTFFSASGRTLGWDLLQNWQQGILRPGVPNILTIANVVMAQTSYAKQRWMAGAVTYTSDVRDAIDVWQYETDGDSQPFLFVPDTSQNSAWYARWNTGIGPTTSSVPPAHQEFSSSEPIIGVSTVQVGWVEASRGRPLGSV
jgi:hypothetical protein